MGDQFAFTSALFTLGGVRAGTFDAACMVTSGGPNSRIACYGLYSLKGGQISGMALIFGDNRVNRIAIVGGTGAYEGVTGSAVETSKGDDLTDVVIHLIYR